MPQPYELWWSVVPGPSQLVEQLTAKGVEFVSRKEAIDTTTPTG